MNSDSSNHTVSRNVPGIAGHFLVIGQCLVIGQRLIPSQSQPRRIDLIIEECTTKYVGMPRYNGTTPKPPDAQRAGGICVCIASFQSSLPVCIATCQPTEAVVVLQAMPVHILSPAPTATMAFTQMLDRFRHTLFSRTKMKRHEQRCWQRNAWTVAMDTWVNFGSALVANKRNALDAG